MDGNRFDDATRALAAAGTTSRRQALRLLAGSALGGVLVLLGRGEAAAACQANGTRCKEGKQCCSGRCVRKPGTDKKVCRRAIGQSICTIENDSCGATQKDCAEPGSGDSCLCYVTTRGVSVCASSASTRTCSTDLECAEEFDVPGARCIRCAFNATGRACALPCLRPA